MNEINQILEPREKLEWEGKPKASAYFASQILNLIIIGGFGSLVVMVTKPANYIIWLFGIAGLCLLILVSGILNYFFIHYAVTNKRIVFQSGIIGRDFKSIDYDKVENISVDKGLVGVIFGVGDIKIFTGETEMVHSGSGKNQRAQMRSKYNIFSNISDPYTLLKQIQTHLSKRKEDLYGGRA